LYGSRTGRYCQVELQETFEELDNIVTKLEKLIDEITNEDYISQLKETKEQAKNELNDIQKKLSEEIEENEKQDIYEYQRGAL